MDNADDNADNNADDGDVDGNLRKVKRSVAKPLRGGLTCCHKTSTSYILISDSLFCKVAKDDALH